MNEFLFWYRHPLVPLLFHEVTSLHPPSFQRNDFPLVYIVIVAHALESEIENGRMNVCRSEEASRVEKWIIGRMEISILTMDISIVEWKFLV